MNTTSPTTSPMNSPANNNISNTFVPVDTFVPGTANLIAPTPANTIALVTPYQGIQNGTPYHGSQNGHINAQPKGTGNVLQSLCATWCVDEKVIKEFGSKIFFGQFEDLMIATAVRISMRVFDKFPIVIKV